MNSKYLILLVLLMFVAAGLLAQQTGRSLASQTYDEFVQRIIGLLESRSTIDPEEKIWLEKFFSSGCECSAIEEEDQAKECGEKLFKSLGLPATEEEMGSMNKEQERKFMLLAPLTNMLGKCPEHG